MDAERRIRNLEFSSGKESSCLIRSRISASPFSRTVSALTAFLKLSRTVRVSAISDRFLRVLGSSNSTVRSKQLVPDERLHFATEDVVPAD